MALHGIGFSVSVSASVSVVAPADGATMGTVDSDFEAVSIGTAVPFSTSLLLMLTRDYKQHTAAMTTPNYQCSY